jgi:hypothetical protein
LGRHSCPGGVPPLDWLSPFLQSALLIVNHALAFTATSNCSRRSTSQTISLKMWNNKHEYTCRALRQVTRTRTCTCICS